MSESHISVQIEERMASAAAHDTIAEMFPGGTMRFIGREAPELSIEQRVALDRIEGVATQRRDELVVREFEAMRRAEQAAKELPPEDWQPLSEQTKARIRSAMEPYLAELGRDLQLSRMRNPPPSVTVGDWQAACERQALREQYHVAAPQRFFWPHNGQDLGPADAVPPGLVDLDTLIAIPGDAQDLDFLDRVEWSPGRPVRLRSHP